jgi:predicted house-cleaning noncanonical NTP pyrophosphatase (MazG superfamily)
MKVREEFEEFLRNRIGEHLDDLLEDFDQERELTEEEYEYLNNILVGVQVSLK